MSTSEQQQEVKVKEKRVASAAQLENLAKARAKSIENRKSLAELARKEKELRDAEVARRWKIVQDAEATKASSPVVVKKKGPSQQVLHVSPPLSSTEESEEEEEESSEDSEKEYIPRLSRRAQRASEKARKQVAPVQEPAVRMQQQAPPQQNEQLNRALRMLRMR
jgi:hypothetical protein